MARRRSRLAPSPLYNAPPRPSFTCPRCGRIFEQAFKLGDVEVKGHPVGDPRFCPAPPKGAMSGPERDARTRRAARKVLAVGDR